MANIPADSGTTYDLGGRRLSKDDPLVRFGGDADELCACLGVVRAMCEDGGVRQYIESIQKNVSTLMAHVSGLPDDRYVLPDDAIAILNDEAARLSENIPQCFVLPGSSVLEAQIHVARAVARRAERSLVAVCDGGYPVSPNALSYLNKLSDYLFALARRAG
jgi:cob(I)alamin adenosyltransferase